MKRGFPGFSLEPPKWQETIRNHQVATGQMQGALGYTLKVDGTIPSVNSIDTGMGRSYHENFTKQGKNAPNIDGGMLVLIRCTWTVGISVVCDFIDADKWG